MANSGVLLTTHVNSVIALSFGFHCNSQIAFYDDSMQS